MKAYPNPGKPGFRTIFRHPVKKMTVTAGLATTNREEADRVCGDLQAICDDPTLWNDADSPRLLHFRRSPRAIEIFFGKEAAAQAAAKEIKATLPDSDVDELEVAVLAIIQRAKTKAQLTDAICTALREFESQRYKYLYADFKRIESKLQDKTARVETIEAELSRIQRATNTHVKMTLAEAYKLWHASSDFTALAPSTQTAIEYACDLFLKTIPENFKLAELRAQHINAWLDKVRGKDGETELSPVTRLKMKRYVSTFVTKAYRDHDLSENPMDKTGAIKGVSRRRENITAMSVHELTQFQEMLSTLKDLDGYWHALVATATLAGPRLAELFWLKLEHINLEQNYIRIATRHDGDKETSTKTGRERICPVEQTTLQAILIEHIERRKGEQKKRGSTVAQKSNWLFPSLLNENPYMPRQKTPLGMWSHARAFHDVWERIASKAAKKTGPRAYWTFGPREWRHCAGTSMGHSGVDVGRISTWLGNSPDICRRFYQLPSESGKLWPFKW